MSQCTNETTQTTMDAKVTKLKYSCIRSANYNVNNQFVDFRQKLSLCTNETTQATIFLIDSKNVLTLKATYITSFL